MAFLASRQDPGQTTKLRQRRHDELKMLTYLTGKSYDDWDVVVNSKEEKNIPADVSYSSIASTTIFDKKDSRPLFATLGALGLIALLGFKQRRKDHDSRL